MKIKKPKKFIRGILVILLIIIGLSLIITKATYSHGKIQYKEIYVSEGETLWKIAKSNQKSNYYYKNKDIRYIVNDLIKINNLTNSNISINQKLFIPII